MGESVTDNTKQTDGKPYEGGRPSGQGGGSTSTTSSDKRTDSTTRGGRNGGTGGTGGNETSEKVVPVMALVDDEEKKRAEKNARRREQYAKKKAENGDSVKPKKVNKKKQTEPETISKESLNMMIAGISSVIATRPDCEHWLLSEKEIDSITTPLCKMLAESEAFKNIGEYSNQIALIVACATVFLPRFMVTVTKQKEKKKRAITGNSTNTNVGGNEGTTPKKPYSKPIVTTGGNETKSSATRPDDGNNVPWYGNPLA